MLATRSQGPSLALPVVRWGARLLGTAILAFWGWFIIAHLVGDAGRPSRPLLWQDFAILTALGVSLVGLAVAWRWELPGGALTLVAAAAAALLNWRVLAFPGALIPAAALMFLASGLLAARRNDQAAGAH